MQKQGNIIYCLSFQTLLLCKAYSFPYVSCIVQCLPLWVLGPGGYGQPGWEKTVQVFLNGIRQVFKQMKLVANLEHF